LAVQSGWQPISRLRSEPDLRELQDDPTFQIRLKDWETVSAKHP
jgi:hypothetical protein